jgi:hypothetical protein
VPWVMDAHVSVALNDLNKIFSENVKVFPKTVVYNSRRRNDARRIMDSEFKISAPSEWIKKVVLEYLDKLEKEKNIREQKQRPIVPNNKLSFGDVEKK